MPKPRTQHSAAILSSKNVYDIKAHVYDSALQMWMQPKVQGVPPKLRQGHIMTVVLDKVYLHGGMFDAGQWSQNHPNSPCPSARAGHCSVNLNKSFFIFGGLTTETLRNGKICNYKRHSVFKVRFCSCQFKIAIDFRQKCNSVCLDEAEVT